MFVTIFISDQSKESKLAGFRGALILTKKTRCLMVRDPDIRSLGWKERLFKSLTISSLSSLVFNLIITGANTTIT